MVLSASEQREAAQGDKGVIGYSVPGGHGGQQGLRHLRLRGLHGVRWEGGCEKLGMENKGGGC